MKIEFNTPLGVYAAWRHNEIARQKSSSGGLASAISEKWIENGGAVYGAAFESPFSFKHIRCTTTDELNKLRGSKYVQSSIQGIFKSIANDLQKGLKVLFIGTPCQVASVKTKFKKHECLFTIDIICHGTPKVDLLKESIPKQYLSYDFDNVSFRDNAIFKISFLKNNQVVWQRPLSHDLYMKGFFKAVFYRECGYQCPYAKESRVSDMTLGDFWGLDMQSVETTMDKGISLVLVNTDKGNVLFRSVEDLIDCKKRPLQEAVSGNNQLRHPMPLTWRHKIFKRLYPKIGFKWAAVLAMPDIVIKNLLK